MKELIRQINHFAEQSAIIEPDARRRRELLGAVNDYTERFLESPPGKAGVYLYRGYGRRAL